MKRILELSFCNRDVLVLVGMPDRILYDLYLRDGQHGQFIIRHLNMARTSILYIKFSCTYGDSFAEVL